MCFEVGVHLVDLGLVNLFGDVALEFEGWRDHVIFDCEGVQSQVDGLWFLKTAELVFACEFKQIVINNLSEVFGIDHCLKFVGIEAVLFSKLLCFCRLNNEYTNDIVLEGVSVDEVLGNVRGFDEDVFKLLWGNVFSLRKFEDVLGSVNDFD